MVRELDIRLLVPGHGPTARHESEIERRVADDLDYLGRLMDVVESQLRAGVTGRGLVESLSRLSFRGAPIRSAQIGFHDANVRLVAMELGTSE